MALLLRYFNKETVENRIKRQNSALLYPFYYAISLSAMSVILLIVYPSIYHLSEYRTKDVCLFLLSGVLNILANQVNSYALKIGELSVVAPYMYFNAILVYACDVGLFKYDYTFLDFIGMFMTIFFLMIKLKIDK